MLGSEIQTLVSSIGWALIHFLWQGTLITLVYWTITRNIQSIHAKYWTGMLLVVISLLIPIINSNTIAPSISISESITPLSSAIISPQQLSFEGLMYFLINASLPYVVLIWSFTVVFLSIRLIRSWMQLANIKHEGAPQVSSELKQYIKNIAIKLDLHTIPLLKISRQVMVPAAYGVLKPTILLPVSLISQIPKDQLEAIIKHELCHLKRNDFIHNIIQLCADILLFFHPGIRWMNNDIRHIREQCCDQMVLEQDTERLTYAKALTNIAAFTNDIKLKHSVHLGINDGMLLNRVKFLLQNKSSQSSLMVFLPFLMIILFLIVLLRPNHTDHNSMNTVNTVGDFQSINQVNNVEEPGNKKLLDYKSFYPKLPVQIEKKPEPIQVDQVNNASAEITQENIIDRPVITSQIAVIDKSELFDDLNKEMQLSNTEAGIEFNDLYPVSNSASSETINNLTSTTSNNLMVADYIETDLMVDTLRPTDPVNNVLSSFNNTDSIKPKFKRYVAPEYPQHFWYNQIEQDVIATFKIQPNGRPYEITLSSQTNNYIAFEQEVEKAMKRWRFSTESLSNSTLQRTYQQIFSFAISDDIMKNCEIKTTGTRLSKPMPCNK